MRVLSPEQLGHVGMAVHDLDAATAKLGRELGMRWSPPQEWEVHGRGPDGVVRATVRLAWSLEGPVHTELIEGPAGSVWSIDRGERLHHLCYGVEDVETASAELDRRGLPVELAGSGDGGTVAGFAYHRRPDGARIELMARSRCAAIERWLARLAREREGGSG